MLKKRVFLLIFLFYGIIFSQSRFEISFNIGYSNPLLEARGDKLILDSATLTIYIDGKRLLVSDNLAANVGYNVQTFLKYNFTKKGHLKGLFSLGYNIVYGIYPGQGDYDAGIRIQTFSAGLGTEINPLGHLSSFYPSVYALFRLNLIGGETFYKAGLDFLKVTSRFGYSAGLNLNFRFNKRLGMYGGYSYSFDNPIGRQTEETYETDPHVIPFRDESSPTNGLTHNRRIAYWSLYLGMNFFFK
ncbi:MAG TPA: hypothetical protein VGK25_00555 [Ignavibacteria bacterium]